MPLYETVFITRQDLTADDVDNLSSKFEKIITDASGKVVSKEYWGLRNLAYKIKKNTRGHYVLLNIDAPYAAVAELNRVISFNENVIRSMTFNVKSHQAESALFLATNAKGYKPAELKNKRTPSKLDLIIDRIQFEL